MFHISSSFHLFFFLHCEIPIAWCCVLCCSFHSTLLKREQDSSLYILCNTENGLFPPVYGILCAISFLLNSSGQYHISLIKMWLWTMKLFAICVSSRVQFMMRYPFQAAQDILDNGNVLANKSSLLKDFLFNLGELFRNEK